MATYLATCQIGRYAVVEQDGPVPLRGRRARPTSRGDGFDAAFGAPAGR